MGMNERQGKQSVVKFDKLLSDFIKIPKITKIQKMPH